MVYLIGVDHRIQHNSKNPRWYLPEKLRDEFKKYLEEKGKQFKATLIAEELSEEALNKKSGIYSNAKYVAGKLGIEHRFCDPNTSEREAIGIKLKQEIIKSLGIGKKDLNLLGIWKDCGKSEQEIMKRFGIKEKDLEKIKQIKINEEKRKDFPKREKFWLNKIKDKVDEPIIFICGYNHVESFKSTLINKGYKVEVLSSNCWGKGL